MCLKDTLEIRSRGSSPVSVSSNSSGTDDSVSPYEGNPRLPRTVRMLSRRSSSSLLLQEHGLHVTAGTLVSATVTGFSWYLPFLLAPTAALRTYVYAQWDYDATQSQFDNSIGTYGTDYFLALCMLLLIPLIPCPPAQSGKQDASSFRNAGLYTRGLLGSYMISVAAGGWAHQFYTTVESQNTLPFRLLWTVCVGAVAIASGFMGAAATSLLRLDPDVRLALAAGRRRDGASRTAAWKLPIIPESFWFAYAIGIVAIVVYGGFSFQRPACDIFVVGITQFPSTFYMMLILGWGLRSYSGRQISDRLRLFGCVGFIFNAPLLPMYPILVQYTDWPLGAINTLLHAWLLVAWTGQGLALRHVGRAVLERSKTVSSAEHHLS